MSHSILGEIDLGAPESIWNLRVKREDGEDYHHQQQPQRQERELCQAILQGVRLLIQSEGLNQSPFLKSLESPSNAGPENLSQTELGLLSPVSSTSSQPANHGCQESFEDIFKVVQVLANNNIHILDWILQNQEQFNSPKGGNLDWPNLQVIQNIITRFQQWISENQQQLNTLGLRAGKTGLIDSVLQRNNNHFPSCIYENRHFQDRCFCGQYIFTDEDIEIMRNYNIQKQTWIAENQVVSFSTSPVHQELQCNSECEESCLRSEEQSFHYQDTNEPTEEWQSSDEDEYYYSDSEEELQSSDNEEQNIYYEDCYYSSETEGSFEVYQIGQQMDSSLEFSQFQDQAGSDE